MARSAVPSTICADRSTGGSLVVRGSADVPPSMALKPGSFSRSSRNAARLVTSGPELLTSTPLLQPDVPGLLEILFRVRSERSEGVRRLDPGHDGDLFGHDPCNRLVLGNLDHRHQVPLP